MPETRSRSINEEIYSYFDQKFEDVKKEFEKYFKVEFEKLVSVHEKKVEILESHMRCCSNT